MRESLQNRIVSSSLPGTHPTVSQGEQTPSATHLEGSLSNSRRRALISLICRQPRYLECLETGGFASPSCDGFALALGNIESLIPQCRPGGCADRSGVHCI